ncbi:protein thylakoid assembly 8 [Quercus suber]|uniref:Protein thylakoid assembly 8 n=1 Tax=Quercus suber TaxID=58331 RepID=A0AAW0KHV5_QUESU
MENVDTTKKSSIVAKRLEENFHKVKGGLFKRSRVYVTLFNDLGMNVTVHCKSGDGNLGPHFIQYPTGFYEFNFKPNPRGTTDYYFWNFLECDDKGPIKLIKAVIGVDRRESTVRIYEMMMRSGWGSTLEANEHVVKVLGKGFRRLGEQSLAVDVKGLTKGNLEKLRV